MIVNIIMVLYNIIAFKFLVEFLVFSYFSGLIFIPIDFLPLRKLITNVLFPISLQSVLFYLFQSFFI